MALFEFPRDYLECFDMDCSFTCKILCVDRVEADVEASWCASSAWQSVCRMTFCSASRPRRPRKKHQPFMIPVPNLLHLHYLTALAPH